MSDAHLLGHKAKKRFGQNFLHDARVIERIVRAVDPKPGERIVEVGPGLGALTTALLPLCREMDAIELDRDVIPALRTVCATLGKLTIYEGDVLKFDFGQLCQDGKSLKLVGNLPYNISTPIMFHLLDYARMISEMIFMVQKEVAERITAVPGNKDYGRLSVMLQYRCEAQYLFIVPPHAFTPAPKVDSAIIRLVPYATPPHRAHDEQRFAQIVSQAFSQRRKTLRNALKTLISDALWQTISIDPTLRPETLSVEQFVAISNALCESPMHKVKNPAKRG